MRKLLIAALPLAFACGPGPEVEPPPGPLDVFPTKAYTGVEIDALDTFTVPIIQHVLEVENAWVSADDGTAAVHDVGDGLAVIEALSVGETVITVSAPGKIPFDVPSSSPSIPQALRRRRRPTTTRPTSARVAMTPKISPT